MYLMQSLTRQTSIDYHSPMKHRYFKTKCRVSVEYILETDICTTCIEHTIIVLNFKKLKTCVLKWHLLLKSHKDCMTGSCSLSKSQKDRMLSAMSHTLLKKKSYFGI